MSALLLAFLKVYQECLVYFHIESFSFSYTIIMVMIVYEVRRNGDLYD